MSKQKILIVDDVPANISVLTEILKKKYKLFCATNGKTAISIAKSSLPDLILLDIVMPGIGGFDVCRILKSDAATKHIPVIFLTAKNEDEDQVEGLSAGAVDFISKPFDSTVLKHKIRIHIELKLHRDNLEELVRLRTKEITNSNNKLLIEIEEHKRTEKDLVRQKAYFSQLFKNSPQAILLFDSEGTIIEANNAFESLFGYTIEETIGQQNKHILTPDEMIAENDVFHKTIMAGNTVSKETVRCHKNGERIQVSVLGYPVSINGTPDGVFIIYSDISQRKSFERQLHYQAFHDSVTGIPNRALLLERLERALERSLRRFDYHFALLMIDLDRFKSVNDSFGHLAGDKLLKEVADRIENCIRTTDTLARMGGDEFAILVDEFQSPSEIFQIARRIQRATTIPFHIGRNEVIISCSIGIVWETAEYKTPSDIIRDADIAMYRAKETGKARFKVFKRKMHEQTIECIRFEKDLLGAINNKNLILYYQPIFSINTNILEGFEALVRWQHPQLGLVMPNKFIPIAEESGLIVPLGKFVIDEAIKQLRIWHTKIADKNRFFVSINISVRQFAEPDLTDYILKQLAINRIDPKWLQIEITESLLIKQTREMAEKLSFLKSKGIKVVLDDFGTGYSSLSYIHEFPIDRIKIDRSFIKTIDTEKDTREIIKTIIKLSNALGFDVVAEGVERETQLENLKTLNCNRVQGFYFSKPLPENDATELISYHLKNCLRQDNNSIFA